MATTFDPPTQGDPMGRASLRQTMLEATPDLVLRVARDGTHLDFYARDERMPLVPLHEVAGRRFSEILPAADAASGMQHLTTALDTGTIQQFQFTYSQSGTPYAYEVRLVPDGANEAVAIIRDVTAERRRQERLQRSQKLESLTALAGGVAHDFNNLLSGILGFAELARRSLPPDAPARGYLDRIDSAAERAAELTRKMLAFSGNSRLVLDLVGLNALVEDAARSLAANRTTKVPIQLELAPDLPPVLADSGQLRQLLNNLLVNAAEATGDRTGGTITLRTRLAAATDTADDLKPGAYVALDVIDNGCGIEAATLDRVFDPFFSTKFTGRGLGLAAVLGIVRGHQGAIRARSEPDRGAAFEVLLPVASLASAGPAPPDGPAPSTGASAGVRTILVVDDEEAVRMVATEALALNGFPVVAAADGHQALAILASRGGEIALVLLDMVMPGIDGTETYRRLRERWPDLPVILSSGYAEQETFERFGMSGLAGFIQKPYRLGALVARVRSIIA